MTSMMTSFHLGEKDMVCSGAAPVCRRSESLPEEPVSERRDVQDRARRFPVSLSSSVPGQDLRHRYTTPGIYRRTTHLQHTCFRVNS